MLIWDNILDSSVLAVVGSLTYTFHRAPKVQLCLPLKPRTGSLLFS